MTEDERPQASSENSEPDPASAAPDQPEGVGSSEDSDTGVGRANAEAAKWRVKYREAEAQRDALAAQLDAVRKDQVGAIATSMGIKATALWASGVQLDSLLGDDGVPDPAKVKTAVDAARQALGIDNKRPRGVGLSGASSPSQPRGDQWRVAFAPRER
jgi:hypothetical protein